MVKEVHASAGADFLDYILTDAIASPVEHEAVYTEAVMALPLPLLPNSHRSHYPLEKMDRGPSCAWGHRTAVLALYEHYKLDPDLFTRWLHVLEALRDEPEGGVGAVLVIQDGAFPALSLPVLREYQRRVRRQRTGAISARSDLNVTQNEDVVVLQWATSRHEYIRRWACGLSILPDPSFYSAHTVAVDALWAGSLVLSRPGARLVSRVAASLLVGVGMHATLLVRTWDDYEAVLFQLLRSRKKMWFLRQQLRAERHRAPMFATLAFKHHLLRAAGLAFDSAAAAADASTAHENRAKIDRAKLPHLLVHRGAHPAG